MAGTRKPPDLPAKKTITQSELSDKMVTIYGPPGVGKSTLASQWGGGGGLFFNCASELDGFEVFQVPIGKWDDFREYGWAISESPEKYPCSIIDTADALGVYCSEWVREHLKIVHEGDLDYGRGWQVLKDQWSVTIAKLAAVPKHGVVLVAHSEDKEVKTRSAQYNKAQIRGVKSIRTAMLDMSDLVLYIDFAEGEDSEARVIKTKPSRYWDAKERGSNPRLPAEIIWPVDQNGWDLIKAAYEEGA